MNTFHPDFSYSFCGMSPSTRDSNTNVVRVRVSYLDAQHCGISAILNTSVMSTGINENRIYTGSALWG